MGNPAQLYSVLEKAKPLKATDIHIDHQGWVYFRQHGNLSEAGTSIDADELMRFLPESSQQVMKAADFALTIEGSRYRFNVFDDVRGKNWAIRPIPDSLPDSQELGIPSEVTGLAQLSSGLVLVTGPTGSGKSTTLSSLVDQINKDQGRHIITIESPVEYVHKPIRSLVRQREVGMHVKSFADGLRDALRQDPDVILIGEMRDRETIEMALRAAETGHLVLSTLHANSAAKAIDRIADVFSGDEKGSVLQALSTSFEASVAQRLVYDAREGITKPIFELMRGTSAVRNLVKKQATDQMHSLIGTGGKEGMFTFDQYREGARR